MFFKSIHSAHPERLSRRGGFTLIEISIYVALFAMISLFLFQFLVFQGRTYRKLQSERDVVSSVRTSMEMIGREIQASTSIYTPSSVFGNPTFSQISLKTAENPTTNETDSFIDFYVDNGRLYMKREGDSELPLTSESVRVTMFNVYRVISGAKESAQITLRVASYLSGSLESSSLITASFSPRRNY